MTYSTEITVYSVIGLIEAIKSEEEVKKRDKR